MNPRTEWACQPVDLRISPSEAPVGRWRMAMTLAVLLALRPGTAFAGANGALVVAGGLRLAFSFTGRRRGCFGGLLGGRRWGGLFGCRNRH